MREINSCRGFLDPAAAFVEKLKISVQVSFATTNTCFDETIEIVTDLSATVSQIAQVLTAAIKQRALDLNLGALSNQDILMMVFSRGQ